MDVSTHIEYMNHLRQRLIPRLEEPIIKASVETYAYECVTLCDLSLDPQRDALQALYCPTGQGSPYDPICMLRSWLLLTLTHDTSSPEIWATRLKRDEVAALLAGFEPGHTPSATAHRDFITRYADGPYARRATQDQTLSQTLGGRHERHLSDTTKARHAEADAQGVSQSTLLCRQLLDAADTTRDPQTLQTRLDDLFVALGLRPALDAGILGDDPQHLTVSGDGTPLATASSPHGERTCACPPGTRCDHPRQYTNGTSQWCYHPHRGFVFGDESYTLSTRVNGHDVPLLTIMGTGNESDFTLSPTALDELLKVVREHTLPMGIEIFVGDGHHDTMAIYQYVKTKGIIPIIPLKGAADGAADDTAPTTHPALKTGSDITLDADGTPLCPGGCRMRHAAYSSAKDSHYYVCPHTHRQRDASYRFDAEQCPNGQTCRPDKTMGYGVYLPGTANPRYVVPIPRDSKRFTALYAERSGVERSNAVEDAYHLDRCTRHAVYGLIRLTVVNVAKHARLRWLERRKTASPQALLQDTLDRLMTVTQSAE